MGLGGPYLPGRPHPGPLRWAAVPRLPALSRRPACNAAAISQAEGRLIFWFCMGGEGRGRGEVLGSRSWDLSDFRLQRLNPLPGLQKGEEGDVASQVSSSAAAPAEEAAARGRQTGEAAALAQKGELFGNRVKGGPLSLGSQTSAQLVRSWGCVG